MPGTEDLLADEIRRRVRGLRPVPSPRPDEIHLRGDVALRQLTGLGLGHVLSLRRDFPVKRPRGLLSPEHLRDLTGLMGEAMGLTPGESFRGFRFDAAGADSPTFRRLADEVAAATGLAHDPADGDCVVSVRPADEGWQVLARIGRRPLSTRAWRQADYRGSLNAALAAAMVELTAPTPRDRFLNVMCGAGTILIERLLRGPAAAALGVDAAPGALQAARRNGSAARVAATWLHGDARHLPLRGGTFDAVCADLPWGEAQGERRQNTDLYAATFAEVRRLCRRGARFVALTQDRAALAAAHHIHEASWEPAGERTFVQRGFESLCATFVAR